MSNANQVVTARRLLAMRALRSDYFDDALFDEHGWTSMLLLFVANSEGRLMTCAHLIDEIGDTGSSGERWVKHLLAEGLVEDSQGNLVLVQAARNKLDLYLTDVTRIFDDFDRPVDYG